MKRRNETVVGCEPLSDAAESLLCVTRSHVSDVTDTKCLLCFVFAGKELGILCVRESADGWVKEDKKT